MDEGEEPSRWARAQPVQRDKKQRDENIHHTCREEASHRCPTINNLIKAELILRTSRLEEEEPLGGGGGVGVIYFGAAPTPGILHGSFWRMFEAMVEIGRFQRANL